MQIEYLSKQVTFSPIYVYNRRNSINQAWAWSVEQKALSLRITPKLPFPNQESNELEQKESLVSS